MTRRDGEEDDEPAPRRQTRAFANPGVLQKQMREELLAAGIDLDQKDPKKPTPAQATESVDRARIRAILEPLGAPAWMIESCPSVELANEYAKNRAEQIAAYSREKE